MFRNLCDSYWTAHTKQRPRRVVCARSKRHSEQSEEELLCVQAARLGRCVNGAKN